MFLAPLFKNSVLWKRTLLILVAIAIPSFAHSGDEAEDIYIAEVMSIEGQVTAIKAGDSRELKQGDFVGTGEVILVEGDGHVDMSLDAEWKNVVRINANTKVFLMSIFPTGFYLTYGDMAAKLDALPKNSTFEIETPIALAAVRGSRYRVVHRDIVSGPESTVFNAHRSKVFLFPKVKGALGEPAIVPENQTSYVMKRAKTPSASREMVLVELKENVLMFRAMDNQIKKMPSLGQIQTLAQVEGEYSIALAKRLKVLKEKKQTQAK
ncbi:MAG: hypothetical protein ACI9CF_000403 [Candidatus Omnitrophota bacterium]|jgi:hypothetical protein